MEDTSELSDSDFSDSVWATTAPLPNLSNLDVDLNDLITDTQVLFGNFRRNESGEIEMSESSGQSGSRDSMKSTIPFPNVGNRNDHTRKSESIDSGVYFGRFRRHENGEIETEPGRWRDSVGSNTTIPLSNTSHFDDRRRPERGDSQQFLGHFRRNENGEIEMNGLDETEPGRWRDSVWSNTTIPLSNVTNVDDRRPQIGDSQQFLEHFIRNENGEIEMVIDEIEYSSEGGHCFKSTLSDTSTSSLDQDTDNEPEPTAVQVYLHIKYWRRDEPCTFHRLFPPETTTRWTAALAFKRIIELANGGYIQVLQDTSSDAVFAARSTPKFEAADE